MGTEHDERLVELALSRSPDTVGQAVAAARELLGMELAYIGERRNGRQVLRQLDGDPSSFGVADGLEVPMAETFCQRILDGRLPPVIRDVRSDPVAAEIPVARVAGVGAYVSVPLRFSDGRMHGTLCAASHAARPNLRDRDVDFVRVIARLISETLEREELQAERQRLHDETIAGEALIAAVEARDAYTGRHSRLVLALSREVAQALGLAAAEVAAVEKVALLHDIGKLAVPDRILAKPGSLDEAEWEVMRRHPIVGAEIVMAIPGLAHLEPSIRAEHERWDGAGYPDGLAGADIPIASRIVLVCDAYHAMTSERPYRGALVPEDALREIERGAGRQFCPSCAGALVALARGRGVSPLAG